MRMSAVCTHVLMWQRGHGEFSLYEGSVRMSGVYADWSSGQLRSEVQFGLITQIGKLW